VLGGGKSSFRKLPELLKRGIFYTDEYKEYESFLKKETERLKCNINDMEIDDDDIYYDVEW
jgi:REP element-mobilizing transposase RayT